jgi:hypothetical protein
MKPPDVFPSEHPQLRNVGDAQIINLTLEEN